MIAFYLAWETRRTGWLVLAWTLTGVAALTKGPVGLALPLFTNLAYAFAMRRPVRFLLHPLALGAFVLVVAPWFVAVTVRHPEFPSYAFLIETFERVTTGRMQRTGPPYYFVVLLVLGTMPWSLFAITGWRRWATAWRERSTQTGIAYLVLWIVVPTVLFTLSQSKRPGYILPVFPAVALLCAHGFVVQTHARRAVTWTFVGLAIVAGAILIAARGVLASDPNFRHAIALVSMRLGLVMWGAGLLAAIGIALRSSTTIVTAFAASTLLLPITGSSLVGAIAADRSARDLATAIRATAPPRALVLGVEAFPPSLPFYLEETIWLASERGGELTSNYVARYADRLRTQPSSTLISLEDWLPAVDRCDVPIMVIVRSEDQTRRRMLEARLPLIVATRRYVAYGPCSGSARS